MIEKNIIMLNTKCNYVKYSGKNKIYKINRGQFVILSGILNNQRVRKKNTS